MRGENVTETYLKLVDKWDHEELDGNIWDFWFSLKRAQVGHSNNNENA